MENLSFKKSVKPLVKDTFLNSREGEPGFVWETYILPQKYDLAWFGYTTSWISSSLNLVIKKNLQNTSLKVSYHLIW